MTSDSTAADARALMRAAETATLATAGRDPAGWPYASLVLVALDHDGSPILLLSDLAEHSKNAAGDDRVALLFDGTAGRAERLTGPRLSVQGRIVKTAEPRHRARFLARHASAAQYADFADFHVYRVALEGAHLVAGFGRIHAIAADDLRYDAPAALAAAEADIVAHMNRDHADAVALYARQLCGLAGVHAALVGVDPEGCDLRVGARLARVAFETPVADARDARRALIALVQRARQRAAAHPAQQ